MVRLTATLALARSAAAPCRWLRALLPVLALLAVLTTGRATGQLAAEHRQAAHTVRAQRFLAGRATGTAQGAAALDAARRQHLALMASQALHPNVSLSGTWQPLGPSRIASATYGDVTGRVTAVAIDPADPTGNTVYLGTTGGGVWKSTNAAGPSGATSFTPLTDAISAFNPNAGAAAIPSLSIGALSVANGVVLAGTGDPNDATDSYYGTGLLRSTDGGSTWTLNQSSNDGVLLGNHSFVGLGFAGFAWSSTTPGLVVAAVSEALEGTITGAVDQTTSVLGIYYSNDSGANWQMSTISDGPNRTVQTPSNGSTGPGNAATSVVWNPVRRQFLAAVRYHGYYASPDGVTWTRLAAQPGVGLTQGACPTNNATSGSPTCPIFRGALAVQPDTGDTFALTVDGQDQDQGLWQDVCGLSGSACSGAISFSNRLPSTPLEVGTGTTPTRIPESDYTMALSAVSIGAGGGTPDTLLLVGTDDLYRCTLANGCVLRNTTNASNACTLPAGVAGSQHAIAVLASSTLPLVYVGNDGGLWRSTDGVNQQQAVCSADDATHFQNLNGGVGSLAEVINFAQHPTDAGTLLAGFGANGSAGTGSAASSGPWTQLAPGEGGTVAIDPANPANWYVSTGPGVSIAQCPHGAACTAADVAAATPIALPQVSYDASLIDPPWLIDLLATSELIIGTCRAWRGPATSPASWNSGDQISAMFSGAQSSRCVGGVNSPVRSLATGGLASGAAAAQNAGSTVLYAGMAGAAYGGSAGGHLFSTQAGATAGSGTRWTDLATSPVVGSGNSNFNPGGFDVSSVAVDAHDTTGQTVYATIMGFGLAGHLYRSTNGGAQWTDISSNLPGAPANSVVVDPGDANTVYVATDTGVYVTQQVTMCASTNCWSVYGVGLPNAPIVQLLAGGGIAGGGANGQLRAATYGRGIWTLPLLTAAAPAALAAMSLAPPSLTFGAQPVGTSSAAQTITVTNTGNAALSVISVVPTGNFTETNSCVGATVAVNATCTVQVSFLPAATGARTGLVTIYGNVAGGQAVATLSGTATPGATIVLTPITVNFGIVTVSVTSAAQNVTISNTGGNQAMLTSETVTGDFRISANTCAATLPPSSGCTVAIVFKPTASGTRTGLLTVTDSAGTQTTALNGTGSSGATDTLAPLNLTFGPQQINTTSPTQNATLTNAGDTALTLISGQITSGDFTVTNRCGNSLNGHASCALAVAYVPKNVGAETGVLTVTDQFRSQTVLLNGFGLAPPGVSLAPVGPLSFGALGVGGTSNGQTVTLTNNGGVTLSVASMVATGDFAIASSTCGATVAVGAACTLQVVFKPTLGGARSGAITVTDNSPSSPQTLALTGTGVDFSLSAGNDSVTITSGSSAVYSLLVTSAAGVPGTAALTCTGAPINATCLVVPASVPLGAGTVTAVVTVATGVATAVIERGPSRVWLALLLPLGALCLRRHRSLERLLIIVVLCGLGLAAGCASGRTIPDIPTVAAPSTPTPTPKGTFTIVVSGTSAGLTRTQNLTLIVQ